MSDRALLLSAALLCAPALGRALEVPRVAKLLGKDFAALAGARRPTGLAVDEDGRLLVELKNDLYDARAKKLLLSPGAADVAAASLSGGRIFFVSGGWLQTLDQGQAVKLLEIPLRRIKLAASGESLFISGVGPDSRAGLFVYVREKGYQHILGLPKPPDTLCVAGERIYYSIGQGIFSFKLGEKLRMEAALPGFKKLEGLAVDAGAGVLYVSDRRAVYAVLTSKKRLALVFNDAGGALRFSKETLYLLAGKTSVLYSISGLSEFLLSKNAPLEDMNTE